MFYATVVVIEAPSQFKGMQAMADLASGMPDVHFVGDPWEVESLDPESSEGVFDTQHAIDQRGVKA